MTEAWEYHQLTNHERGRERRFADEIDPRILQGYRSMQPDLRPPQFKRYAGIEAEPVADDLSDVLFLSAGVVRMREIQGVGRLYFRAAGSAGNLSPLELYVVRDGRVLHYEPPEHALTPVGLAAAGPTAIVVTGVPWRTAWKYTERGFRHLYWDCGTMLAQLLAVAPGARVELGFVDAEVTELVGADGTHEFPLAVVVFDGGADDALLGVAGRERATGVVADRPIEFPLITATQRAGDLGSAEAVAAWRAGSAAPPAPADLTFGESIDAVIGRRGSTRTFDRTVAGPRALLVDAFAAATAPLNADFVANGDTLVDHHVLVHSLDGFEPGGYRWSRNPPAFEFVRAGGDEGTRTVGAQLTLGQALGGEGCYTAFHGADLEAALDRLGPRGYRAAQLEAGVVEGRLHLAAFALGFGATGLTFFDADVRAWFGTSSWPMLVTAVGKPTTAPAPAGTPGHPAALRPW